MTHDQSRNMRPKTALRMDKIKRTAPSSALCSSRNGRRLVKKGTTVK